MGSQEVVDRSDFDETLRGVERAVPGHVAVRGEGDRGIVVRGGPGAARAEQGPSDALVRVVGMN